jgi:hypothetical protein
MKKNLILAAGAAVVLLAAGCASYPPGAERGPHGTMAFDVLVDASPPGARIEANGNTAGQTPVHVKIFGNRDGTFHDFGSYYYIVRAYPVATNQFGQMKVFWTGRDGTRRDTIPQHIYFDMSQYAPVQTPPDPPRVNYYYPPPYPYPYYGPAFRFYVGPGPYYWHH